MGFLPSPQEVAEWVAEHRTTCAPERTVTLRDIRFGLDGKPRGECVVEFDGIPAADPISFCYDECGRIEWGLPMFHSPLGVPASYGAYLLTRAATDAIDAAFASVFPKIRGWGINRETGEPVHGGTPLGERAYSPEDMDELERRLANPELAVTIEL